MEARYMVLANQVRYTETGWLMSQSPKYRRTIKYACVVQEESTMPWIYGAVWTCLHHRYMLFECKTTGCGAIQPVWSEMQILSIQYRETRSVQLSTLRPQNPPRAAWYITFRKRFCNTAILSSFRRLDTRHIARPRGNCFVTSSYFIKALTVKTSKKADVQLEMCHQRTKS